jgi:exopolysaccharide production protein ExoZ
MLKNYQSIQIMRAVAVLLVLIFHINAVSYKYFINLDLPKILQLGKGGVDLFFVISGFIMIHITKNIKPNLTSSLLFMKKRIIRIYPVYWFYTFIVLCLIFIDPSMVNSSQTGDVSVIKSLLLLPQSEKPILNVGWTLVYEMYFYVLIAMVIPFLPWKNYLLYLLGLAIAIIIMRLNISIISPTLKLITSPLVLEFILGGVCAFFLNIINEKYKRHHSLIHLIMTAFCILFVTYIIFNASNILTLEKEMQRFIFFGITSFFVLFIFVSLESLKGFKHNRFNRFLIKMGDSSYSIYLSHILVLKTVCIVWNIFIPSNVFNDILQICMVVFAVFTFGYLSFIFIEKPLTKRLNLALS